MVLQGCNRGPESAYGFRLPEGSPDMGLKAIRDLRCQGCHDIPGVPTPAESTLETRVTLGGEVSRVKTYGELVTAIINPSHELAPAYREEAVTRDGESLMEDANLNDVITVQELIDIVAYLQPHYKVQPPEYNPYSYAYE
jgi:hypothetical protein